MKNATKICLGIFGLSILLLTSAFGYKFRPLTLIDKFGETDPCFSLNKSSGGSKTGYTQSAPDQVNPGTCSSCHSGGTATPVPTITASPAFGAGNTYVPGTTYTITYKVTGYPYFGFDLEMNNGNTIASRTAGTLAAGTNSKYTAENATTPVNITQSAPISQNSSATFTWVAPTTAGITVYLFSNALGVNGAGTGGDKEVFKNMVLTPAAAATTLTLTCGGNQTINSSQSTVVPDVTAAATATTTCAGGVVTKTQSPAAGTPLTAGNNTITVTATDNCGNTKTCTTVINHVINTGVLTLTCPGNQTINSTSSTVVPNIATSATASTTCPGGAVTKTQSPAAGTPLTAGANTITVTATDNCGNTKTCTSVVTYVLTGVLSLTCPPNQTLTSSQSTVVPNLTATATASTTCSIATITKTQSPAAGTPLNLGANTITIIATDNCGNTQTCTSTVTYTVNSVVLTLVCPTNQTILSSQSTVVPNVLTSTNAVTTCAGAAVNKTQSPAAGTPLAPGNNTIIITATDNCGNTQTCSMEINHIVNSGTLSLTCPGNSTINSTQATVAPNLTAQATASTTCPGGNVTKVQSPVAGTPLTIGSNPITITATDNCGNTQTCTTVITYEVSNAGVLNLTCGGNQTISATQSSTVPNLMIAATANTTCFGGAVNVSQIPAQGTPLVPGNNTVTVTATDNCGNTKTCTSTINYINNTASLTLSCGPHLIIPSTQPAVIPDLTGSTTATTTCINGSINKTQSPAAGTPMQLGSTVVFITAIDNCNNTQICQQKVTYMNTASLTETLENTPIEIYPNPATGILNINFELANQTHVAIALTDMNGKLVRTLQEAEMQAGEYTNTFELTHIEGGIYFVRISLNEATTFKKVIIK